MTVPATESEPTANPREKTGRDTNVRCALGDAGGPGNPYSRQAAEYQRAFLQFGSIAELGRIVAAIT